MAKPKAKFTSTDELDMGLALSIISPIMEKIKSDISPNSFNQEGLKKVRKKIKSQITRFEEITRIYNEHYGLLAMKNYNLKPIPDEFGEWFFDKLPITKTLNVSTKPTLEE